MCIDRYQNLGTLFEEKWGRGRCAQWIAQRGHTAKKVGTHWASLKRTEPHPVREQTLKVLVTNALFKDDAWQRTWPHLILSRAKLHSHSCLKCFVNSGCILATNILKMHIYKIIYIDTSWRNKSKGQKLLLFNIINYILLTLTSLEQNILWDLSKFWYDITLNEIPRWWGLTPFKLITLLYPSQVMSLKGGNPHHRMV